jgi:RNA polymerase sigma-70 factor (ECF subfamily)
VHETEQQIMEGIRNGDEACFQQAFNTYYEKLCDFAFTLLRDMDEAEDAVQSIFLKIWEKRDSLMITNTLKSYLYRAVHNHCINQLEHREIKQKHIQFSTYRGAGDLQQPDIFPHELESKIQSVIDQLPEQCGIIFKMSRYEELRYAEIAAKLGISVNTVENQISKALKILRTQLSDILS